MHKLGKHTQKKYLKALKYLKHISISVSQFKKVFNRSLLFIFRKMFIYISFDLQTVSLNCFTIIVENKEIF